MRNWGDYGNKEGVVNSGGLLPPETLSLIPHLSTPCPDDEKIQNSNTS